MILAKKNHLQRYLGLHPNLDTTLHFIMEEDLNLLPNGTTLIEGNQIFVNHFQYTTQPATGVMEAHEYYVDIHVPLSGTEIIACCDTCSAQLHTPYDSNKECALYQADDVSYLHLNSEYIAITFQEDAHEPKIMANHAEDIDKLVFKVKM